MLFLQGSQIPGSLEEQVMLLVPFPRPPGLNAQLLHHPLEERHNGLYPDQDDKEGHECGREIDSCQFHDFIHDT